MHHGGVSEPCGSSSIGGSFPEVKCAFGVRLMKNHELAISGELRPVSIAQAYAELARIAAVRLHPPNMPVAASIGMKRDRFAIERGNGCIIPSGARCELPLAGSIIIHHPNVRGAARVGRV